MNGISYVPRQMKIPALPRDLPLFLHFRDTASIEELAAIGLEYSQMMTECVMMNNMMMLEKIDSTLTHIRYAITKRAIIQGRDVDHRLLPFIDAYEQALPMMVIGDSSPVLGFADAVEQDTLPSVDETVGVQCVESEDDSTINEDAASIIETDDGIDVATITDSVEQVAPLLKPGSVEHLVKLAEKVKKRKLHKVIVNNKPVTNIVYKGSTYTQKVRRHYWVDGQPLRACDKTVDWGRITKYDTDEHTSTNPVLAGGLLHAFDHTPVRIVGNEMSFPWEEGGNYDPSEFAVELMEYIARRRYTQV